MVAVVQSVVEPQTWFAYFFAPTLLGAHDATIGLFIAQGLLVHRFSVAAGQGHARTSFAGAEVMSVLWQISVFRMQSEANSSAGVSV